MWPFRELEPRLDAIRLDVIVAKPGDTVVLRSEARLSEAQRQRLRDHLGALNAGASGIRYVAFEGDWQAMVIDGAAQ